MRAEPARLNSAIAWLFVVGASCFALGTIPAYVRAGGGAVDAATFFVGSIFFTSASYCQLVQAQSPGMTGVDERRQHAHVRARPWAWWPRDKNWIAAATQLPGTLFFNHSTFAALAHNLSASEADKHVWRPDVFGSVLFLVSSAFAISALGAGSWRPRLRDLPWWIAWLKMLDTHRGGVLPRRGGANRARLAVRRAVAQRASRKMTTFAPRGADRFAGRAPFQVGPSKEILRGSSANRC